jgi:hypothetical protein
MTRAWRSAVALVLLVLPAVVVAHGRSVSYSRWMLRGDGAVVSLRLPRADLVAAGRGPGGADLPAYAAERLRLLRGGSPCAAAGVRLGNGAAEWVDVEWTVRCPVPGAIAIESHLLAERVPDHLHLARIDGVPGGRPVERALQARDGAVAIGGDAAGADPPRATFMRFVALGIEHIATGWDHLAFVVALLLLAESVREVVWLATGFTVAHSLTLALAVTGVVRPDQQGIEALIGLSIALVAAENVWLLAGRPRVVPWMVTVALVLLALAGNVARGHLAPGVLGAMALFAWCHFGMLARVANPARLRVAVAFAFGLVHGFGFAGVLAELALPAAQLVVALAGFNVGVELGQLAVIALVWPLVRAASRAGGRRLVADAGSSVLCGLGVFWLVLRTFAR